MEEDVSSFGPVIRRYGLCIVYYLWTFSYPENVRRRRIDLTTDSSRKDFLGAVKPFVAEIAAALEDPACRGLERRLLEDFAATYEAVLDLVGGNLDRVETTWDQFQLTADTKLNRALFEVFRGLDLYRRERLTLAKRWLPRGWERLLAIEKRRALPGPLQRLLRDNQHIVAELERDLEGHAGDPPPEDVGLPSVDELLAARQEGRDPLREKLAPPAAPPPAPPPPSAASEHGLVIDLPRDPSLPPPAPASAAPVPPTPELPNPEPASPEPAGPTALEPERPRAGVAAPEASPPAGSSAPPQLPSTVPQAAPGSVEEGLDLPLAGLSVPDLRPPAEPRPGALRIQLEGEPGEHDSAVDGEIPSLPPQGIDSMPPVDLDALAPDEEENPWADITDEVLVTPDEFASTSQGDEYVIGGRGRSPVASVEEGQGTEEGASESAIRRALEAKSSPPDPRVTTAPGVRGEQEVSKPPSSAVRHAELADLFDDED